MWSHLTVDSLHGNMIPNDLDRVSYHSHCCSSRWRPAVAVSIFHFCRRDYDSRRMAIVIWLRTRLNYRPTNLDEIGCYQAAVGQPHGTAVDHTSRYLLRSPHQQPVDCTRDSAFSTT